MDKRQREALDELVAALKKSCAGMTPLQRALYIVKELREADGGDFRIEMDDNGGFTVRRE